MRQKHEFEIITNKTSNFKAFINVLKYRAPHVHLDYEFGMVLYGHLDVIVEDNVFTLQKDDIICINPCQIHEFSSDEQATMLLIQVNSSYFNNVFPLIQSIEFTSICTTADFTNPVYMRLRNYLFQFAELYMKKENRYELKCAGILNLLFSDLLDFVPYSNSSLDKRMANIGKADRIRRIADYIDSNYSERIRLSDIADLEGVTPTHISHFFTENFHMTFQEYLSRLRCEKARRLLLTTDLSLFDISISCGFSDPKYLNSGFEKQYGCLPKNYRHMIGSEKLATQQSSMLTTQQILSDKTSLVLLQKSRGFT